MTLFNSFFNDFKNDIYKNRGRKLEKSEKPLFYGFITLTVLYEILTILLLIFRTLAKHKVYLLIMFIVAVLFGIVYFFMAKVVRKNSLKYYQQHKENVTDKIIDLLKSRKYNFYSSKKVNWLVDCCNKQKSNNNYSKFVYSLKSISNIILPIVTLFIGAALGNLDTETMIYLFVIVLSIIIIGIVIYLFINPIFSFILFSDKECIDYLIEELEYIETEL